MFSYQWWYTPYNVVNDPRNNDKKYFGEFSWCQDGATSGDGNVDSWFEMLDAWYDPDGNGADGGCNGYQY